MDTDAFLTRLGLQEEPMGVYYTDEPPGDAFSPKAGLGGWDPSDRKYFQPDEITFCVPYGMFRQMVERWPESFLVTPTWDTVLKKIRRSRKTWGEEAEAGDGA